MVPEAVKFSSSNFSLCFLRMMKKKIIMRMMMKQKVAVTSKHVVDREDLIEGCYEDNIVGY